MIATNLEQLPLQKIVSENNEQQSCRVTFPLLGTHGTNEIATVFFELEPGKEIGQHTDNAEELLIVLQGQAEILIKEESQKVNTGGLVVVPSMFPHNIKNTGNEILKVLGVFGGKNQIIATFANGWLPEGEKVVDTAFMHQETRSC